MIRDQILIIVYQYFSLSVRHRTLTWQFSDVRRGLVLTAKVSLMAFVLEVRHIDIFDPGEENF